MNKRLPSSSHVISREHSRTVELESRRINLPRSTDKVIVDISGFQREGSSRSDGEIVRCYDPNVIQIAGYIQTSTLQKEL